MSPTRVVHLAEDLRFGGMERVIATFAALSARAGRPVEVVCTRALGEVAEAISAAGIPVELVATARPRVLTAALKRRGPFILHAHGAAAVMGRIAGKLAGARAVVTHLHRTERLGWRRRLFDRLLRADATLACSKAALADFERQGGRGAELLYNPVDAERFRFSKELREKTRAELGIPAGAPAAVLVGRFVPLKGHDVLLAALPRILAARPDARFLFIGEGPERARVEKEAARFGAAAAFLGQRADVRPYLCAADVYLQPSTSREAMSVATLEALACSRPVVATRLEGFLESVEGAGRLVAPGDPRALADAIVEVFASPEKREELGRRGRERVERLFSAEVVGARLERLYRRLAGE